MTTLLPAKKLSRFIFAQNLPNDLLTYLPIDSIPIAYGGKLFVPNALDNTCVLAEPITRFDYQVNLGRNIILFDYRMLLKISTFVFFSFSVSTFVVIN